MCAVRLLEQLINVLNATASFMHSAGSLRTKRAMESQSFAKFA